jgi:sporulation protein YlmC with PRC-barrel domain
MKARHRISLMVALATSLGAAGAVLAQAPEVRTASRDNAGHGAAGKTVAEVLENEDARVSELLGKRVVSPGGAELGEIEDLLATTDNERPPLVVLSVGGVLDVGDKWYATSLEELRVAPDGESLVLDKTERDLDQAPPFNYAPRAGEAGVKPGATGPGTTNSIARLLGATVVDDSDESIGEIDDLVVSTGKRGTRAIIEVNEDARGIADGPRVAMPLDELHVEFTGEEAAGIVQQPRVRAGTAIEGLPAYEYPSRGAF